MDFLNRKLPAYLDTGLNWVHVRDVAIGHILAAEKGRFGERYILGNADGNWTMQEMLQVLKEITGLPAPKMKVPHWVALAAAHVDETISRFTGKPPKAPLAGVRMAKYKMWFHPAKGHPRTRPAANAGETGARRCSEVVSIEWLRSKINQRVPIPLRPRNGLSRAVFC